MSSPTGKKITPPNAKQAHHARGKWAQYACEFQVFVYKKGLDTTNERSYALLTDDR